MSFSTSKDFPLKCEFVGDALSWGGACVIKFQLATDVVADIRSHIFLAREKVDVVGFLFLN